MTRFRILLVAAVAVAGISLTPSISRAQAGAGVIVGGRAAINARGVIAARGPRGALGAARGVNLRRGAAFPFNSFGFRSSSSLYGLGYVPVPPYFALHPPVYYGDRVHSSYGLSPFAGGPYGPMPRQAAAPAMIINRTVPPAKTDQKDATQTAAVEPQLIINPFVKQPEVLVTTK